VALSAGTAEFVHNNTALALVREVIAENLENLIPFLQLRPAVSVVYRVLGGTAASHTFLGWGAVFF
jgi:hypothetical protein